MPMPRTITRFNRAYLNRLLGPVALHLPGFGVIIHRGRTSGKMYRTPVNIFKQPNGYVIALTYGVGDWVRNVLAAGECTLVTRGRSCRMTQPQLVHDEQRRAVPAILRFVGAVGHVCDFLYLSHEKPATATRQRSRVPAWIPVFNPIVRFLLAAGVPMGPEVLLTVRGRMTGLPRSTPVAVAEISGKLWLVSPWGETDWARNLRAAGRATLGVGRGAYEVTVAELGREERIDFFGAVLNPYLRSNPVPSWIVRHLDQIPQDPREAAAGRIVFELHRHA